jgi:hypothetical protein
MPYSLTWLRQVLLDAGLKVAEQPDWQNRGRGDVGEIVGVICHHTGGARTGNMPSLNTVTQGRPDLAGPLAQLCLGRDGTFFVVAAGRCNHAGIGNWQGFTSGNGNFIGIEAENMGSKDDPWPAVQMEAYRHGVAALLTKIRADAIMCCGHREYALPQGRKDDPTFDMDDFRRQVAAIIAGAAPRLSVIPAIDSGGRPTVRRAISASSSSKFKLGCLYTRVAVSKERPRPPSECSNWTTGSFRMALLGLERGPPSTVDVLSCERSRKL